MSSDPRMLSIRRGCSCVGRRLPLRVSDAALSVLRSAGLDPETVLLDFWCSRCRETVTIRLGDFPTATGRTPA
jgi:hypothetical protein